MISTRTSVTVPIALALALLAGPSLAGCSVQGLINSATGGKVTLPGKSVPSDFPSAVPLAKGTVVLGAALGDGKGGKLWNVTIQVDNATLDSITSDLKGAGFTDKGALSTTTDNGGTATFDNGTYSVIVVVAQANGKVTANYTVGTDNKK